MLSYQKMVWSILCYTVSLRVRRACLIDEATSHVITWWLQRKISCDKKNRQTQEWSLKKVRSIFIYICLCVLANQQSGFLSCHSQPLPLTHGASQISQIDGIHNHGYTKLTFRATGMWRLSIHTQTHTPYRYEIKLQYIPFNWEAALRWLWTRVAI